MVRRTLSSKITVWTMVLVMLAAMLPAQARSLPIEWAQPEYYSTIQTADIDGDGAAELLVRSSLGLFAYRFGTASQAWEPLYPGDLGLSDTAGWAEPEYYRTLQTADIDGDGAAELLVRGPDGLLTYRLKRGWFVYLPLILRGDSAGSGRSQIASSSVTQSQAWELVDAGDLGMSDANAWDLPQHYRTLQTGDIDGDGAAELLGLGPDGLLTYRFNTGSNTWQEVDAGDLAMAGWSNPAYYSTIQTGDIDGDGAAELLVRRAAGVTAYHFNTVSQTWGGADILQRWLPLLRCRRV